MAQLLISTLNLYRHIYQLYLASSTTLWVWYDWPAYSPCQYHCFKTLISTYLVVSAELGGKFGNRSRDKALFIIMVCISYHPMNQIESRRYRYCLVKLELALVDELIIDIVILIFNLLFSLSYIFVVNNFLVIDIACWGISAGSTCKSR